MVFSKTSLIIRNLAAQILPLSGSRADLLGVNPVTSFFILGRRKEKAEGAGIIIEIRVEAQIRDNILS